MTPDILPGLSEYQQLHLNLGQAIAKWQDVDLGLFEVFHKVSGAKRHVASAILFQIISFEAKLAVVNAAAVVALDGTKFLPNWQVLHTRTKKNEGIRNKLAHYLVAQEAHSKTKFKLFLEPNPLNAMFVTRYEGRKPPQFQLKQVASFAEAFIRLGGDLTKFSDSVRLPSRRRERYS